MLYPRILILDDDPVFGALLVELLTEEGHPTTPAPTGPAGLAAGRRLQPALVILDLPPLTPAAQWQFLAPIGQDARTAGACVIVSTAYITFLRLHGDTLRARGWGVLEKPMDLNDLLAEIERQLQSECALRWFAVGGQPVGV
jgi:CheY-like chemotaxis protein